MSDTPPRLPTPEITIRLITADDRELWEPLWDAYLEFYQKTVPQMTTDITWKRLTTPRGAPIGDSGLLEGLLALDERGKAVGMVHFFFHPSTSRPTGSCYIEDL